MKKSNYRRLLLPAVLIAALIVVFLSDKKYGLKEIPLLIGSANKSLILLIIGLQFVFYILDGLLSLTALRIVEVKVHPKHAISIAVLSAIGGKVIPMIGASLSSFFLYRKLNIETKKIAFLVTVWNIFYILSFTVSFGVALILLPKLAFKVVSPIVFDALAAVFGFMVVGAYLTLRNRGRLLKNLVLFLKKFSFGKRLEEGSVSSFIETLDEDLALMKRRKWLSFLSFLFSALYYIDNVALLYFSFLVFGFRPDLASLIIAFSLSTILSLISLMPEVPGVTETSIILIFTAFGYPSGLTILASVLYRLISYWLLIPVGAFFYFKYWDQSDLKSAWRAARKNS
ncbi:MAG TPA: flippase-like domain-containing protein [Candidatus Tyrphobacter sp.]|nr:flippase-like domain-containing protein [Candidatus Tyrphobacter sp.]